MKRIAVLFVVLLCLITGLGCETERGVQNPVHDMPEHMPTDFNFSVRYGYGDTPKNEVNTYNHQIEKDLIQLGKATATITLTTEEMSQIYSRLYDMNVMGLRNVSFNQSWGGHVVRKYLTIQKVGILQLPGRVKHWNGQMNPVRLQVRQSSYQPCVNSFIALLKLKQSIKLYLMRQEGMNKEYHCYIISLG